MTEHFLKIVDKAAIESALEDSTEYQFTGVVTIDGMKNKPDGEGGYKITYDAKFTSHLTLIKGDKTFIKGKTKSRVSQRMRARAWVHAQEQGIDGDKHYEEMGRKIISYWEEVCEYLKNKS